MQQKLMLNFDLIFYLLQIPLDSTYSFDCFQ